MRHDHDENFNLLDDDVQVAPLPSNQAELDEWRRRNAAVSKVESEQAEDIAAALPSTHEVLVEPAGRGLDISIAPGCYGMLYCEGPNVEARVDRSRGGGTVTTANPCFTCPFASTCKPLAEQHTAVLRAKGHESHDDRVRRQARVRKRKSRAGNPAAPAVKAAAAPVISVAPILGATRPVLAAPTVLDKLLEATTKPGGSRLAQLRDREFEFAQFYDVLQFATHKQGPNVSNEKVAMFYERLIGEPMNRDQAKRRRKTIMGLIAEGVLNPL